MQASISKAWGFKKGFEVLRSLYINKNTLKDIVALQLSYHDTVPTLKNAERGMSVLWCVTRTMVAVTKTQAIDGAAEVTAQN